MGDPRDMLPQLRVFTNQEIGQMFGTGVRPSRRLRSEIIKGVKIGLERIAGDECILEEKMPSSKKT